MRRCRSFGQAVAFLVAQPVFLKQALGHCLRHGRTATADIGQAAQIKLLEVRAGKQVNHHGGNVGPVRHLVLRNQAPSQLTVPARHQHHGGTHVDARMHHGHHARDVEHGDHGQRDVFTTATAPHRRGHGIEHDAGMRVHAALGQASGAAGVGQHAHVLRPNLQRRRWGSACQGLLPKHHLAAVEHGQCALCRQPCLPDIWDWFTLGIWWQVFTQLCHHHLLQTLACGQGIAGLGQLPRQISRGNGHFDIAIRDVVLQLLRQIHRIDGHHHCVGTQDGKVRHHQLRQVLHQQHDTITLAHSCLMQVRSQALGTIGQLSICDRAAKKLQRCFSGITAGAGVQVVPQGRFQQGQCMGNTTWPMIKVRAHNSRSISGCECLKTIASRRL